MHRIFALLFQRFQLIYQDAFTVVQQAADQGAFSIINAAGCYKSK
jgi:hypothetical protein